MLNPKTNRSRYQYLQQIRILLAPRTHPKANLVQMSVSTVHHHWSYPKMPEVQAQKFPLWEHPLPWLRNLGNL